MGMMIPPFDDRDDAMFVPPELEAEIEVCDLESRVGKPCLWFDELTRKCKHYEYRPQTCRDFDPGCDVCLEDRQIYQIEMEKPHAHP